MKPFVRNLLAVITGIAIMWLIAFLIITLLAGRLIRSFNRQPQLPGNSVLVVDLSTFHMGEQTTDVPDMDLLSGMLGSETVGLWDACDAIVTAAYDPGVRCLYLKPDGGDAGAAALEELRSAVELFHQSGKPVVSYLQNPANNGLYLGAAADKVFMTPSYGSQSGLVGVSLQMIYLKDLLDRLGVNVQLIRHGKYKSAGEMYVRSSSSPENLEQNRALAVSIWESLADGITGSRDIPLERLDSLVNGLGLILPEDFLREGLVDELADKNQVTDYLCKMAQVDSPDKLNLIALPDYIRYKPLADRRQGWKIAVIFISGELVDTPSSGSLSGDQYADLVEAVRLDDSVKAVVLRVNSPGGSVLASDKIRAAVDRLGQEKTVIASYGDYAASGGYWISSGCREIYTDAMTLTGSIGVFTMIPDFSKTAKDLVHVGIESVGSHKHSDIMSLMRPLDKEETAAMQQQVEAVYGRFVELVAGGRNLTPEFVDSVGQGRVWTGTKARELGLADQIGTLQDALFRAAVLSGGPEEYMKWQVVQYPAPAELQDMLLSMLQQTMERPTVLLENTPFAGLSEAFDALTVKAPFKVWARLPYAIDVK